MDFELSVVGMVINVMPIGEADKRITILTGEMGKISAFVKGARRPQSQFLASTNPFVYGRFELYQGRNSFTVKKVTVANYFRELAKDYEASCYGFYFLEVAQYFSVEGVEASESIELLYMSLKALTSRKFDYSFIKAIFQLKTLMISGTYPDFFSCKGCKRNDELIGVSFYDNALYCDKCAPSDISYLDTSTVYALQYIMSTPVKKIFSFKVSSKVLDELVKVSRTFFDKFAMHSFKSEEFLK